MPGSDSEIDADFTDEILGSVSLLLKDLREGDPKAGLVLWNRYLPRLTALADRAFGGRRMGIADPDDAVQSAWISFWKKLDAGSLPAELKRDDFWNLLGLMVVRKARRQLRRESAEKRGQGKTVRDSELEGDAENRGLGQIAGGLNAADFDIHSEELLTLLDEECQRIALLRLLGHKTREIAEELGCTERKIQRKLELIRLKWNAWVENG